MGEVIGLDSSICPECQARISSHCKECPYCGHKIKGEDDSVYNPPD